MFKRHSLQVRVVKDAPVTTEPTLVDAIRTMSPEELEQISRKLMLQAAICVGGVLVTRIVVDLAAEVIANAIEYKISKKL